MTEILLRLSFPHGMMRTLMVWKQIVNVLFQSCRD